MVLFNKSESAIYFAKYQLSGRKYLGPTSTDNVLAFLMVFLNNLGKLR
jgi:hypothetical protein